MGRARLLQAGGVIVVVLATVVAAILLRPGHGGGTDLVRAVDAPGSATATSAPTASRSATPAQPRPARHSSASPAAVTPVPAGTPAPGPQPDATSAAPAPPPPAGLSLRVTLSKQVVHYGERVRVTYDWSDGDGDLVDVNRLGFGAFKTLHDVPCKHDPDIAHPISRQGSFWWSPAAALLPPGLTDKVRVAVGFNVRTGGCARVQEKTVTRTVTVLPAPLPTGGPSTPQPPDVEIG